MSKKYWTFRVKFFEIDISSYRAILSVLMSANKNEMWLITSLFRKRKATKLPISIILTLIPLCSIFNLKVANQIQFFSTILYTAKNM